jgi:acyl-CoA synthetase (AMP-forming)/AMP-acid ligase II
MILQGVQWAEIVFKILQYTGYNLQDMIDSRVNKHPDKILFREMSSPNPIEWSYEQIQRHLKEIAAVFYYYVKVPRVAIYSDNCLEGGLY